MRNLTDVTVQRFVQSTTKCCLSNTAPDGQQRKIPKQLRYTWLKCFVFQNSPRLTTRSKFFLDSTGKPATPRSITTIFTRCHRLCAVAKVTSLQPFARSVHRLSGGRLKECQSWLQRQSASMLAARVPKQHCVFLLIGTRHGLLSGCQTRQNRTKKPHKS